jgi:hypothetical protein
METGAERAGGSHRRWVSREASGRKMGVDFTIIILGLASAVGVHSRALISRPLIVGVPVLGV